MRTVEEMWRKFEAKASAENRERLSVEAARLMRATFYVGVSALLDEMQEAFREGAGGGGEWCSFADLERLAEEMLELREFSQNAVGQEEEKKAAGQKGKPAGETGEPGCSVSASIPPVNRVPENLEGMVLAIEQYTVGSWTAERNGKGPATEVHFMMKVRGMVELAGMTLVMRLRSAKACDVLIQSLQRHRADVWPETAPEGPFPEGPFHKPIPRPPGLEIPNPIQGEGDGR